MMKQKNHQSDSHCRCYLIFICSIIFAISFVKKNIYLSSLIPDNIEERSELTVQYYDKKLINNSFISFTNFNPDLLNTTAFKEDMTESKWDVKKAITLIKDQTNVFNNKCQMCGSEYQNPSSNSSKRDLILSFYSDLSIFKLKFISSLRASRCQATIVLFVSNRVQEIIPTLSKITDNCGVIIINIKEFSYPYFNNKELSYHILFHEFLKEFRSDFDRVVILNPLTIIAQTDPFTTYFTYSTVGVTTSFYNEKINFDQYQYFGSIDPDFSNSFYESKGPYLSSSILYGSVDGMLMFYGILFNHSNFQNTKFDEECTLAAYINYFYHRGIFDQHGLKLFVAFPGHFISSVEKSEDLKIITKSYFASPFNAKRKIYFTLNYYRELHALHKTGRGLNPPAIIGISSSDPFHSIHFLGCSNIIYKKRLSVNERKRQNHHYYNFNNNTKKKY